MSVIQIEHNNRIYKDKGGHLEITNKSGRHFPVPYILYKYYPLNKFTVDAIANHYLYASNPSQLNDRFDCDPQLVSFNSFEDELSAIRKIRHDVSVNEEDLYHTSEFGIDNSLVEYYYKHWGIISLSKVYDEILMWSHYAKDDGICIGFYTDRLPLDWIGPYPIEYVKKRDAACLSFQQITLIPLIQCFQKNIKWKYEKEFRFLINLPRGLSRKATYDTDAIAEIYLGRSFFKDMEIKVDEENFHVTIDTTKRYDLYRRKLLDTIAGYCIPVYYDLTLYIDEIQYKPYRLFKEDGVYGFYYC